MGLFDRITNYFSPPAPAAVPASSVQNATSGDPFFDGLVATVNDGKMPRARITQDQANPYLKGMYAAKKKYEQSHPKPKKVEGWGEWFSRKWNEVWSSEEEVQKQQDAQALKNLDAQPIITNVYAKGVEYGEMLAGKQGGHDVILAEDHDQTAQYDAMVGIVAGLKAKGDTRQIIIVNENMFGSCEDGAKDGIEEWNVQTAKQRKSGLGDYFINANCCNSSKKWYETVSTAAKNNPKYYTLIPMPFALNAISKLAPDVKYFEIDVNHGLRVSPAASRDAAMAMMWLAIRKANPDAIIIGNFGASHAVEHKVDAPKIPDNRILGADFNDPLAEQLIYARASKGEQNAAGSVHTICVRATGEYLHEDAYGKPVYENNGAFDLVWHVAPQTHGDKSSWNIEDHFWAKG